MSRLFVLKRRGLVVVSGTVMKVDNNTVSIVNDCYLPVLRRTEKREAVLRFDSDAPARMHLRQGAFVVATALDDPSVGILFEGGETPRRTYYLKGKNIRYSGALDFAQYMTEKEMHVFVGNVMSVVQRTDRQDRPYSIVAVSWKTNGQDEIRNLVTWQKTMPGRGKRVVAVAGQEMKNKKATFFPAASIEAF